MASALIFIQAVISATGVLLLRNAASAYEVSKIVTTQVITIGALGILAYGSSFVLWILILGKNQVAYAFPLTIGISLVITTLGAFMFFGESISSMQFFGIVLLIVAVALIGLGASS